MKLILILAAAIVIGLSGQTFARLGQTEEQVSALFGKPKLVRTKARQKNFMTAA